MDKVTKFLEQHVQWFTLGFAVLFLGWAGYTYLYVHPLHVAVGSPPVDQTPGTIDPAIRDGIVASLDKAINNPEIQPPKVVNVLAQYHDGIGENTVVVTDWNPSLGTTQQPTGGVDTGPVSPGQLVDTLPALPPAMPDLAAAANPKITAHWTVIMVPAVPVAATAPAAPGQPPMPAAPPVMVRRDIAYWSGRFKLDLDALTKEYSKCFKNANLPLNAMNAEFVRVELLREEQTPAGVWDKPTVVATLPIHDLLQYPADKEPAPATDELRKKAWYEYKTWLEQNQDIISHPAFYQTAPDAEPWVAPGTDAPAAGAAQPGAAALAPTRSFDPSRDTPHTDAERAQADAYHQAQLQAARERASRGRPGIQGPPGGFIPPNMAGGRGMPNPGFANSGAPQITPRITPFNGVPPSFAKTNGGGNGFNPGLASGDAEILVHDTTIQEGKTYRYAVRYKLINPIFDKPALAVAQVAAKFDINSPDPSNPQTLPKTTPPIDPEKLWTPAVTVEPRAHIFVQAIQPFTNQAEFVVYTWKDGHWSESTVKKATPGDALNAGKAPTPWTVVDVRKDPHSNEPYVLLMDSNGVLTRRDVASDALDPKWPELKAQAGTPAASASAR